MKEDTFFFNWEGLREKADKWKKQFDEIVELIGNNTIAFNRQISCYHKYAPKVYERVFCDEIKVDDYLIKGDIVLTVTNKLGKKTRVVISRSFEAKTFGEIASVEILFIKIKDYLVKRNKKALENFASAPL